MANKDKKPLGPDLSEGICENELQDGIPFGGHVGDDDIVLVRRGQKVYAIGALCTHYQAPMTEGLVVDDTIRCAWHHACFDLHNGEAQAPALSALPCWRVETRDGKVYIGEKLSKPAASKPAVSPSSIIIVGGGGAGEAAVETLRSQGYDGPLTLISADSTLPCDRPNLSKDFLAGKAPEAWLPLRSEKFFSNRDITLRLTTRVKAIDTERQLVHLKDGNELQYGALLLATGSDPVRLPLPGGELSHVFYLRTMDDAQAIIEATKNGAKRAVVLGASFIGLEVAASLRKRDLEVHVVAPEAVPMARIMGDKLGQFVQNLHESKGVVFHLEQTATRITSDSVTLENDEQILADIVIIGVGVKPNLALAEAASLKIDRGIVVDAHLQTSAPNVYAAGDIARWPDPHSGQCIRVEHWVVAQRQGQTAARNMLGAMEKFTDVPFFWSQHYNATINYSGHAESWDHIETDGDPAKYDFSARFIKNGKTLALATIYRDLESLRYEAEMEQQQKQKR